MAESSFHEHDILGMSESIDLTSSSIGIGEPEGARGVSMGGAASLSTNIITYK